MSSILPRGPWGAIVADPPWPYEGAGPRAAPSHRPNSWNRVTGATDSRGRYGALSMDELKAMPVARIGARNAHLYLWFTNTFGEEAHQLARAWGFKPKTILTWVKTRHRAITKRPKRRKRLERQRGRVPSMKTGFYFRGATEHILFCVRGSLRLKAARALPTAFFWPRLPHSVKPPQSYALVEEASPGPYLELFARRPREGWTLWGNQAPEPMEAVP